MRVYLFIFLSFSFFLSSYFLFFFPISFCKRYSVFEDKEAFGWKETIHSFAKIDFGI